MLQKDGAEVSRAPYKDARLDQVVISSSRRRYERMRTPVPCKDAVKGLTRLTDGISAVSRFFLKITLQKMKTIHDQER